MSWVKLPRNILKQRIFKSPLDLQFYIYMLCNAQWEPQVISVGNEQIELQIGDVFKTYREIARDLNISVSSAVRYAKRYENGTILKRKAVQGGTVFSVANFETYKGSGRGRGTKPVRKAVREPVREPVRYIESKDLSTPPLIPPPSVGVKKISDDISLKDFSSSLKPIPDETLVQIGDYFTAKKSAIRELVKGDGFGVFMHFVQAINDHAAQKPKKGKPANWVARYRNWRTNSIIYGQFDAIVEKFSKSRAGGVTERPKRPEHKIFRAESSHNGSDRYSAASVMDIVRNATLGS